MILWFTGQPGSGKTTICNYLKANYFRDAIHIDGDDIREIFDNKDYSELGRRKNIDLAQNIASFLHNKRFMVLVSLVSPYLDQREQFKQKMGDDIKEFWIHTSEIRGREDYFVKEYMKPLENFISIDTTELSIQQCVDMVVSQI